MYGIFGVEVSGKQVLGKHSVVEKLVIEDCFSVEPYSSASCSNVFVFTPGINSLLVAISTLWSVLYIAVKHGWCVKTTNLRFTVSVFTEQKSISYS